MAWQVAAAATSRKLPAWRSTMPTDAPLTALTRRLVYTRKTCVQLLTVMSSYWLAGADCTRHLHAHHPSYDAQYPHCHVQVTSLYYCSLWQNAKSKIHHYVMSTSETRVSEVSSGKTQRCCSWRRRQGSWETGHNWHNYMHSKKQ